jgi:hypothetical protein
MKAIQRAIRVFPDRGAIDAWRGSRHGGHKLSSRLGGVWGGSEPHSPAAVALIVEKRSMSAELGGHEPSLEDIECDLYM